MAIKQILFLYFGGLGYQGYTVYLTWVMQEFIVFHWAFVIMSFTQYTVSIQAERITRVQDNVADNTPKAGRMEYKWFDFHHKIILLQFDAATRASSSKHPITKLNNFLSATSRIHATYYIFYKNLVYKNVGAKMLPNLLKLKFFYQLARISWV